MTNKPPAQIHAPELTMLDSLPGSVTLASKSLIPFADLYALDLGPNTSTERFSVPAIFEHVILITVDGCSYGEARIAGQLSYGQTAPGRLNLLPSGVDSEWRINRLGCRNFNIFLSSSLLERVAAQTLAIDPARAAPDPRFFFEDPLIFHLGMEISRTVRSPAFYDLLYLESLSNSLAVHLLHNYVSSPATRRDIKGRLPAPILKQTLDFIADCSNARLTLAQMADLAHMSPYYFSRLFKQSVGQSVHQYVLSQRLEHSYRLLLRTDMTIAQIADEAGFADESHFIHRFKALFGVPPGALRKESKIVP